MSLSVGRKRVNQRCSFIHSFVHASSVYYDSTARRKASPVFSRCLCRLFVYSRAHLTQFLVSLLCFILCSLVTMNDFYWFIFLLIYSVLLSYYSTSHVILFIYLFSTIWTPWCMAKLLFKFSSGYSIPTNYSIQHYIPDHYCCCCCFSILH